MSQKKQINSVKEVVQELKFLNNKKQEYFVCLSLDSGMRLIRKRVVTIGLLDRVMAHPREVYSDPLKDRAAAIIIAHNHPSGDTIPSKNDLSLTQQLAAAGQILGVDLKDHVIVSGERYFSFAIEGLLETVDYLQ